MQYGACFSHMFSVYTAPSVSSYPVKRVRAFHIGGYPPLTNPSPFSRTKRLFKYAQVHGIHKTPRQLTRSFARFKTEHTPPKFPIFATVNRNLRHQRIVKQLPHILGQEVRSRAVTIILHASLYYKEKRGIFLKICVDFLSFFQRCFVYF